MDMVWEWEIASHLFQNADVRRLAGCTINSGIDVSQRPYLILHAPNTLVIQSNSHWIATPLPLVGN